VTNFPLIDEAQRKRQLVASLKKELAEKKKQIDQRELELKAAQEALDEAHRQEQTVYSMLHVNVDRLRDLYQEFYENNVGKVELEPRWDLTQGEHSQLLYLLDSIAAAPDKRVQLIGWSHKNTASNTYNKILQELEHASLNKEVFLEVCKKVRDSLK